MTDIRVDERGRLLVDDAKIIYRNFAGRGNDYNREGDRNFSLVIPPEFVEGLLADGWNVKEKVSQSTGEKFYVMPVTVKYFDDRGDGCDAVMKKSNGDKEILYPDNIGKLDRADIVRCDMDIRPRYWTYGTKSGKSAQVDVISVEIRTNRFAEDFYD